MKITSFSQFAQILSKKPSLIVVYSKDEFEQKSIVKLLPEGQETLEGGSFSKEAFFQATEQNFLFKKNSHLIIKEAQQLPKTALASIDRYLQKPRPDFTLLLLSTESFGDLAFKKLISEKGVVFTLLEEKPWDKKARLVYESNSYLEKAGVGVETKVLQELVESFLHDQMALRNELDKWIAYLSKGQKLSKKEAEKLTVFSKHETIWMVGEAIFKREREQAYRLSSEIYDTSSFFAFLGGIRSQIQTAIEVLQILHHEGKALITKKFPYLQGALLDKKIALYQNYGLNALYAAKVAIYDTELKAKQVPHQENQFLERLIIQITDG